MAALCFRARAAAGVLLCAVAVRVHVHVYVHIHACYCRAVTWYDDETFNPVHVLRSGFAGSSNAYDIFYSAQTKLIRALIDLNRYPRPFRARGGNNRAHGHPSKVPVRPRPAPTTAPQLVRAARLR